MYTQSRAVHCTQEYTIKKSYAKINSCTAMLNVRSTNPINSNKFTEFDMKK